MLVNVHEKGYTNTNTSDPSFRIFTVQYSIRYTQDSFIFSKLFLFENCLA